MRRRPASRDEATLTPESLVGSPPAAIDCLREQKVVRPAPAARNNVQLSGSPSCRRPLSASILLQSWCAVPWVQPSRVSLPHPAGIAQCAVERRVFLAAPKRPGRSCERRRGGWGDTFADPRVANPDRRCRTLYGTRHGLFLRRFHQREYPWSCRCPSIWPDGSEEHCHEFKPPAGGRTIRADMDFIVTVAGDRTNGPTITMIHLRRSSLRSKATRRCA